MHNCKGCVHERQGRKRSEVAGGVVEKKAIVLDAAVTVHPLPDVILPLQKSLVVDHSLVGGCAGQRIVGGVAADTVHADAHAVAVRVLELRREVVEGRSSVEAL